jgi:hypothetical protein
MIVSDSFRRQLTVHKQTSGDVVLRWPRGFVILSQAEVDRIYCVTNEKARLQRFPAAPKSRPESPHADDLTLPG